MMIRKKGHQFSKSNSLHYDLISVIWSLLSTHHLTLKFSRMTLTSELSERLLFLSTKLLEHNRNMDAFFMQISRVKPVSPQPSSSSANGVNLSPGLTMNMERSNVPDLLNRLCKREMSNLFLFRISFWYMICNSEICRFSRKYGLPCASKYITCYLVDFWFHTDTISRAFGFRGPKTISDSPSQWVHYTYMNYGTY